MWGEIVVVVGATVLSLALAGAAFVRHQRLDGSGMQGGLPFYPSTASGGFAETPKPAWVTEPWLDGDDPDTDEAGHER